MNKLLWKLPALYEVMPYFGTLDEWMRLYLRLSKNTNEIWKKNAKTILRFPIKRKEAKTWRKLDSSFIYFYKNLSRLYENNKIPALEWRTKSEYGCLIEFIKKVPSSDIIQFSWIKWYLDIEEVQTPTIKSLNSASELDLLGYYKDLLSLLTISQLESIISYYNPAKPLTDDFPYVPYSNLNIFLCYIIYFKWK